MAEAVATFFLHALAALAVGALVGLERERRREDVVAGVRTFPLIGLTGFLTAYVADATANPGLLAAGFLVAGAVAITFTVLRHQRGTTGFTTPMAILVTFLLGVLVAQDLLLEAVALAVVTTVLLLTKRRLHRFAEVLDDREMMEALQFIAVAFVLLPLAATLDGPVPDTGGLVGPGALFDPFWILLLVLFVSSLSFVSFLVMRAVGPHRGVEVSGLLGGLVNSEATSVSLAHLADERPALAATAVVGSLLATSTMFVRNLAIAAFAERTLAVAGYMVVPLLAMTVLGVILLLRLRGAERPELGETVRLRSPFALGPAVRFAILFALLNAFVVLARDHLGTWGIYAAALGGFVSAGAVVASLATLHQAGGVPLAVAGRTAVLATVIGAFNKLVVLRATNRDVYERARLPFAAVGAVGLVALLATLLVPGL